MSAQPGNDKAIRCLLDVLGGQRSKNDPSELIDRIPPARFGRGKARILRKMVLLAIAANAKPDGAESYPSLETIARRCLVSVRAVRNTIEWLVEHGLLRVEMYAGPQHTNRYTVLFNPEIELLCTHELNPEMEVPGAKSVEHTSWSQIGNQDVTKTPNYPEVSLPGEPGRMEGQPGSSISDERPLERPFIVPKETHDAEGSRSLASERAIFLPVEPTKENNGGEHREPTETLLIAARVLAREHGEAGIQLACYIAAHSLCGTGRWPETKTYYMTAAENYDPEHDDDFKRTGETDHYIFPDMIENGIERLGAAILKTGHDPEPITNRLENLRERVRAKDGTELF
jgi:Helix-turn-helix domain